MNALWDKGLRAFDEAIGWGECQNDDGAACPSIAWQIIDEVDRGQVLQISHGSTGDFAGFFIGTTQALDLSGFANGFLEFDIKVVSGDSQFTGKLDCIYPCTSGDISFGDLGGAGWQSVKLAMSTFTNTLDLRQVDTGIVIWATSTTDTVFQLDNIRFTGLADGEDLPTQGTDPTAAKFTQYGAGNISDRINPDSYRCVVDHGNWIYNAGIVEPGIAACDASTQIPTGTPTKLYPQLADSFTAPTPSHRWWGSVAFMGEMQIGDPNQAAYITPDPITARITNKGFRMMGIPSGFQSATTQYLYPIPDPFSEVFDGIAIANNQFDNLNAVLKDYSDGSVTVLWQSADTDVMQATFVYGSPYVFIEVLAGNAQVKTLREDGGEKSIFHQAANQLGVKTSVAGNTNHFLIVGDDITSFSNISSNVIGISAATNSFTVAYLPANGAEPNADMINAFASLARNKVAALQIDYQVDPSDYSVTVQHQYLDATGAQVQTLAGLQPLQWKNNTNVSSNYQTRSARGVIKFMPSASFDYHLPYVGILPYLPTMTDTTDITQLTTLVNDFVAAGQDTWNTANDTYWAGKNYGKVAELIAIAESINMSTEAGIMRQWLKDELADWFTADSSGSLDTNKYFVFDEKWSTLLGIEESFASHQQLNDHHFHYGYFVRAAAEICRVERDWCSEQQYGPMIELLIRDYAAMRDDDMFPYTRNFDPANGFSWASGKVNFARGNNNESTSEAANAYGAIVLYGLITGKNDLAEHGIYLHASTTATYWEYWNNLDGYYSPDTDVDNFPAGYDQITTSIIWGDGASFSTWFSGAPAHILGIQGLPTNTLNLHVGLHAVYMADYVQVGLTEATNGKPSGLPEDRWRDIWWNLSAMVDADDAVSDYLSYGDYNAEAGESKAHTYQWIHAFKALGNIAPEVHADYPLAVVFSKNGTKQYVIYNMDDTQRQVTFSDGVTVQAPAGQMTVSTGQ